MEQLQGRGMGGLNFGIDDGEKFKMAMTLLRESLIDKGATLHMSDSLVTWYKNLSFLREEFFLDYLKSPETTDIEKSVVWRVYILLFFAEIASTADGDYVELGCHTGNTAWNVLKKIDLNKLGKKYYLYDLFEWNDGDEHTKMDGHKNETMYSDVVKRFAQIPFVTITKGSVPASLDKAFPDKIAFAHIDMNHPDPESGALEQVLPRLSQGGVVIFDDYGWWPYSAQKIALDPIAEKFGYKILELPTGQGLLMNNGRKA